MKENKNSEKNTNVRKRILLIIQIFFLIILIYAGIEIIKWYIDNNYNDEIMENISEAVTIIDESSDESTNEVEENIITETIKYKVDFEQLKEANSDTVAWLKVNNTNIQYPVVKTNDNSYYLTHNFEQKSNKAGWVFADYRNEFDGTDKNIVIYGHNMKNGSMFGTLKKILNSSWYNNEENKYITFITENENAIYEVFSVYQIEKEDYYIQTSFKDDAEFISFIDTIKSRSIKDFNVDVTNEDNILTLSTCASNNQYRVVLHAKKTQ